MSEGHKVMINDHIIYFDQLETSGDDSLSDMIRLTETEIKNAIYPIIDLGKMVKDAVGNLDAKETELTIQFSLSIEGSTPIFKVMTGGAEAQFSVKFTL